MSPATLNWSFLGWVCVVFSGESNIFHLMNTYSCFSRYLRIAAGTVPTFPNAVITLLLPQFWPSNKVQADWAFSNDGVQRRLTFVWHRHLTFFDLLLSKDVLETELHVTRSKGLCLPSLGWKSDNVYWWFLRNESYTPCMVLISHLHLSLQNEYSNLVCSKITPTSLLTKTATYQEELMRARAVTDSLIQSK